MSYSTRSYIINNITLPINASHKEAFAIEVKKLSALEINSKEWVFTVYKRSVDARKKDNILFVYSISVRNARPTGMPKESRAFVRRVPES